MDISKIIDRKIEHQLRKDEPEYKATAAVTTSIVTDIYDPQIEKYERKLANHKKAQTLNTKETKSTDDQMFIDEHLLAAAAVTFNERMLTSLQKKLVESMGS